MSSKTPKTTMNDIMAEEKDLNQPRVIAIVRTTKVTTTTVAGKFVSLVKAGFKAITEKVQELKIREVLHNGAKRVLNMGPMGQAFVIVTAFAGIVGSIYAIGYGAAVGLVAFVYYEVFGIVGALIGNGIAKFISWI